MEEAGFGAVLPNKRQKQAVSVNGHSLTKDGHRLLVAKERMAIFLAR